ncbi:MAG TPA: adenosylcobinamide-phosphate synthase CbiB [Rubrobacteraceae bacterium]|nr:adenosylcobinamide-phosphate synthase CbiB [Rubrobacteraceae bacterium]
MTYGRAATAVAAALTADRLLGEPPTAVHPTVLMGRAISLYERRALALYPGSPNDARRLGLAGLLLAAMLPALALVSARAILRAFPAGLRWPVEVALLWTTISMRGLADAALAVGRELERGDLGAARVRAGEIVGRDTGRLSEGELARAAVESVAENASDGVVAPMLYGLLFGAPGALAYKAINTLDSMVGHPHPPHRDLGRASARLDDLANLLPARLTALTAASASGNFAHTWKIARLHGPLTKSPNAGWSESAFAGALGVALGGANSYGGVVRVGPTLGVGRTPEAGDIVRAIRLMHRVCVLLAALPLVPLAAAFAARSLSRRG